MTASRHLPHDWFDQPLPANVTIGERSWLYSTFAFRHYHSRRPRGLQVGHDTGLYNGTFFDLGPRGEVVIGDYCSVVGAIFCTNHSVEVGDYVFIAHEVVLADEPGAVPFGVGQVFNLPFLQPQVEPPSSQQRVGNRLHRKPSIATVIADDVWIGARVSILGPVHIAEGAIIGAGAVVTGDVPPFAVAAGNPARIIGSTK